MSKSEIIKSLKELKQNQFDSVGGDFYMQGLFNGIELSLAAAENRDPFFIDINGDVDPKVIVENPERVLDGTINIRHDKE